MKKSLGMACAASAVAVLVGWGAIAGLADARDARAGVQQHQQFGQATWQQPGEFGVGYGMQDYGAPGQVGFTGQPQFHGQPGIGQQHAWGTTQFQQPGQLGFGQQQFQPQQQFGWGPQQFQQPGQPVFGQQQFHTPGIGVTQPGQQWGQIGMMQPGMMQPGMMGMGVQQHPTLQLMQAAEQLRQSIRTLAQQHPTRERERAIDAAERALWQANQATMAVAALAPPPPMALTVFGPDGRPLQQQFWGQPGIGATQLGQQWGMVGQQFQQPQIWGQQLPQQPQFQQPQVWGQQFQQQPQAWGQQFQQQPQAWGQQFQQPQAWGQQQFQQPQPWGQPGQQQFWGDPGQQQFGGAG